MKTPNHEIKSAGIVASIGDLLTGILLRVPIRSLIRFKTVSKQWCTLIDSPQFRLRLNSKLKPAVGLFFVNENRWRYDKQDTNSHDYISFFPHESKNGPTLNFSFAREPSRSAFRARLKDRNPIAHTMFTTPPPTNAYWNGMIHNGVCFNEGVYWNGSVHWLSDCPYANSLRFSVDHQVLEEMPSPPQGNNISPFGFRTQFYLGQSCDHLHCIKYTRHVIAFDVYEMKRNYSEWFVRYKVDLSSVLDAYPRILCDDEGISIYCYSIFCMVRGEQKMGSFLVLQIHEKAIKYNLDDKTFEDIYDIWGPLKLVDTKGIHYIESLCPIG